MASALTARVASQTDRPCASSKGEHSPHGWPFETCRFWCWGVRADGLAVEVQHCGETGRSHDAHTWLDETVIPWYCGGMKAIPVTKQALPLGPEPKPVIAPPGTCKLIGCPGWGVHDPHGIGAPSQETWERTSQPKPITSSILVDRTMAHRLTAFCQAIGRDPGVARTHTTEGRILGDYLKGLL